MNAKLLKVVEAFLGSSCEASVARLEKKGSLLFKEHHLVVYTLKILIILMNPSNK